MNEEPRCQSMDASQRQLKFFYRRRKVYSRRKFQQPCVPAVARAIVAHTTSILPEYDCEVHCNDGQETSTSTSATTTAVEKSEDSAPSSASPKAWEGQRSTRMKRAVPSPPVLAGVAGTMREEDGINGNQPEAAATANIGRPPRRRKRRVFKGYVNTSTKCYEWITYSPGVPYPGDYEQQLDSMEQLGEVEIIATVSAGGSLDISDISGDKSFSLKMETGIQKTCKARRILVEDALSHFVPTPKTMSTCATTCPAHCRRSRRGRRKSLNLAEGGVVAHVPANS